MGMKKMSLLFVKLMSVNASHGSCLVSFLFFFLMVLLIINLKVLVFITFSAEFCTFMNWVVVGIVKFCVLFGSILDMLLLLLQSFFLDFGWRRSLFYYVRVCD